MFADRIERDACGRSRRASACLMPECSSTSCWQRLANRSQMLRSYRSSNLKAQVSRLISIFTDAFRSMCYNHLKHLRGCMKRRRGNGGRKPDSSLAAAAWDFSRGTFSPSICIAPDAFALGNGQDAPRRAIPAGSFRDIRNEH